MDELGDVSTKHGNTDYRLSESKSGLFKTKVEWIGHKTDQNGIRPLQDELLAITEPKKKQKTKKN